MRQGPRSFPAVNVVVLALLMTAGITLSAFAAAPASPRPRPQSVSPSRIAGTIDDNNVVRLSGNTRPEANPANDRGAVADSFNVEHILLLLQRSPQQEQELDAYIESLNDRNSPNFHQWLTAAELGERYGVGQEDIDTITAWLETHGFRINQIYPSHMAIDISGTASQIRSAFHTSIHNLEVGGATHIANIGDPMIPAALAQVVKGPASLNDFKPHPTYKKRTDYTIAGECTPSTGVPTEPGTCYAVTPQDNQTIYNLNPVYAAGYSGQGQTIVLIEDTDTYGGAGDWNSYRNAFGLTAAFPLGSYTQVHPGCTDPGVNGDDGEAAIDVEVATAIAPSAAIELASCASGTVTFGGLIALTNLVNASSPYPGIVSVSYGVCEAFNGNGGNQAFYNTYQQAASEGISVFVSSGDEGPSSCSADFSIGGQYDVASLGVTGWGESPFNVSVGGTDFEDVYNSKTGGAALSTYWSATNSSTYGSALSYIPEMPWNDACADVLISEIATGSFTPYGASPAICNNATFDTSSTYLSTGAASGGASNCATGQGGTSQGADGLSDPQCQGYAKPSYQTGSALAGGKAVYGANSDGVRDIPDVSMFAANGIWGHFETVCWSDPAYTSDGSASCAAAPSTWSGFGGTSVATPTMAAIQALVNQKTGSTWGNPNPMYYQIGQNQYGTAGGTFLGTTCNSSTGNTGGCAFNDVTQGDIDSACEDNGTLEEAHCYKPTGKHGVDSTDNVTAATVLVGGSGYTSAPTCTIAGPTNNNPYKAPTGVTLWAGGTQAACTAAFNAGTNTAKWTVAIQSTSAVGIQIVVGSQTYTLSGSSTTNIATALTTAINANNTVATATSSTKTVTITAKVAGAAGNFNVSFGSPTGTIESAFDVYITNTVLGEGPGYVSGITITTAGSGYQPETPITLTGGGGTGAVAVANTSIGTAAQSYQPAYGAAPGYDMATGLGTPNANALVNNCVWTNSCQTITVTTPPPSSAAYNSSFTVAATASSGLAVAITSSGSCSGSGTSSATITMTSATGTCLVIFNQAGNGSYSPAPTITDSVTATLASQTITFTTSAPASAPYGSNFTVAASASSGLAVAYTSSGSCSNVGATYTMTSGTGSCSVIANQSGNSNYSAAPQVTQTTSATPASQAITFTTSAPASAPYGSSFTVAATGGASGNAVVFTSGGSCSNVGATYTITSGTGTCSVIANQAGNTNYSAAPQVTQTTNAILAATTTSIGSSLNPSTYGQSVVFTATVTSATGQVKKGNNKVKGLVVGGSVTWSDANGAMTCSEGNPSTVTSGTATCTVTNLAVNASDTITGNYGGDVNHSSSSGSTSQTINAAGAGVSVTSSLNPSVYGQSVQFTATISGQYGLIKGHKKQVATGSVAWSDANGSMSCSEGNPSTVTSGVATCTVSNLAVNASDTITGAYSGDSNHNPGSGSVSQTINAAGAGVSVTSSLNPSVYGQSVQFTATISGQYGLIKGHKKQVATGSVTWSDSNGAMTCSEGNPSTVTSGVATCTTSTLAVNASDTITGNYSGDSNHNPGSGTVSQTINAAGAGVSVTSSLNPSVYGQSVQFTATISGQYGLIKGHKKQVATGSVAWTDANGSMTCSEGNPSTVTAGAATCTTSILAVNASDTITGAYSGDSNHNPGSGTVSHTINQSLTTTAVVGNPNPSTYAEQVVFTATVTSSTGLVKGKGGKTPAVTGTVSWSSNTGCSPSTVTNGVATCTTSSATRLPVGNDTVTGTYSGDANHTGSTGSESQLVTGGIATTIDVTSVSPSSEDYGNTTPTTITALLSWTGHGAAPTSSNVTISGNGNGSYGSTSCAPRSGDTITCTATYTPSAGDTAGNYTEKAAFSGDANYASSSSPETNNFTINQATSSTAITSDTNPSTFGQSVTFTATISGEFGLVKGRNGKKPNVTGTVAWSSNTGCGTTDVTPGGPGNPGTATCITSSLATGTDIVVGTYSGDSNHSGSSGSFSQSVGLISQTITFTTNAPASAAYNSNFTVAATGGGSGNPVVFTSGGSCSNVGATYTMTSGTGSCSVIANQAGNSNYSAAPQVTQTTNATVASQTITFTTNAPASAVYNSNFTVAAGASSGLAVAYTSSGSCSNVGATYTMTSGTGSCSVIANQAGNSNYSAAPQVTQTTNATKASQTISFTTNAPASAVYNSNFTVAAGASSGLAVAYTSSGSCSNVGATYTMTSGTGSCSVIANQAGNSNYSAAPQVTQTTNATKASQTISFTTNAPASAVYNSNFTVAAGASSGLAVAYTSGGSCSNVGATYTMTSGTGSCSVIANQAGNSNYSAAPQVTQTTSATLAAQAITVTFVPTTATKGSMFTVMATGGGSGNALVYTNSTGDNCTNVGATYTMGTKSTACSVIINQAGNSNYSAAPQVTKTVTVAAAIACGSQCSITGAPASAPYLSTFTVGTTSGSDTSVPTVTAAGACTISGSTVSMTKGTGTCTITAIWAANYVYEKATVTAKVTATKGATVTSITGNTPNPCNSVPCTVAVNSTVMQSPANATYATGNVVVTASTGEHCSAAVSTGLSSCNLVFHTTGSRTITATYDGSGNNSASTSAPVSQGVN